MQFQFTSASRLSEGLLRDWTRIALSTRQADPFCCTPAWQLPFHEIVHPERRLLVAESSGSIMAFAEESSSPEEVFLTPLETSWFFGCPLMGKDAVALLAEAMPFLAHFYSPQFPGFVISGIRSGGVLARRLFSTFGALFNFYQYSVTVPCTASLAGGVDGFLSRRTANHRAKLRKSARRARQMGVDFERVAPGTPEEASAVYARMLAVEATSWKGIGACGMAESPSREFYEAMMRCQSRTRDVRVIFARHEGQDIGFIFGGMAGRIYRGQQFSFADSWRPHSIGNLLQLEKVIWLCEEGAARYDMGSLDGPKMEYKSHWTEKSDTINTWVMLRK